MANAASRQQSTALFLYIIVMHKKTYRTDQKTAKPDGETCAVPENIQFSFSRSFFYTVKMHSSS